MSENILEIVNNVGMKLGVDRDGGIIHGVKILGLESRNGRTYPRATIARAVGLYEGAKVNVNHPAGSPNGPRRYEDRIGILRNVQADGTGLRGDFHFNPKHALAEQLAWDAEHAPENVGFSHNVEAKVGRKGGGVVVEEITRVQSVNLVADPATTRGLFEEVDSSATKRTFVESVANEIGMPLWAVTPLDLGLSYCHTRDEIKIYLEDIQGILIRKGVLSVSSKQIAELPRDAKDFAECLTGKEIVDSGTLQRFACQINGRSKPSKAELAKFTESLK